MQINPYLLDALYAWGKYRRQEDIRGMGYSTTTMEYRMMQGTAWSTGGETAEPEYDRSEDAQEVNRTVQTLPDRHQIALWTRYVGNDGPMEESEARIVSGCRDIFEYTKLIQESLRMLADKMGYTLYVR